jgi:hypothetical protein
MVILIAGQRSLSKALISGLIPAIAEVPIREEEAIGNDRFITAVTLLRQPWAISSGV